MIPLFLSAGTKPTTLGDDIFLINYNEDPYNVRKRFEPWLEKELIRGLTLWRDRL